MTINITDIPGMSLRDVAKALRAADHALSVAERAVNRHRLAIQEATDLTDHAVDNHCLGPFRKTGVALTFLAEQIENRSACLECARPLGELHKSECGSRAVGHPEVVQDDCEDDDSD